MQLDKREILRYVGDTSQLFGIEEFSFTSGKARGMRAINVRNGSGLEYTILPDRCMEIGRISLKAQNIVYLTATGMAAPQFYNGEQTNFLRTFAGGGLTMCGFTNTGAGCEDQGKQLGLHGYATGLPAENVGIETKWTDVPEYNIGGRIRQAAFYGENIILNRIITSRYGDNSIYIHDSFSNDGFRRQPFMLLYHTNIGYPVVQKNARMFISSYDYECMDEHSEKLKERKMICEEPQKNYNETVYFHKMQPNEQGDTVGVIFNPDKELGVAIWSRVDQLGRLTQWNMFGEGEYAVGLEPSNAHGWGRAKAREDGTLQFIEPGEIREVDIRIEIFEGEERMDQIQDSF